MNKQNETVKEGVGIVPQGSWGMVQTEEQYLTADYLSTQGVNIEAMGNKIKILVDNGSEIRSCAIDVDSIRSLEWSMDKKEPNPSKDKLWVFLKGGGSVSFTRDQVVNPGFVLQQLYMHELIPVMTVKEYNLIPEDDRKFYEPLSKWIK